MWFDNVRVPACNVLGEVGNGFGLAMQWIGRGRLSIPARAVGPAQGLLQLGLDYARQRKAVGQPIADYQAIQWLLADSAIEIEQVKWATLHAAWVADQGRDPRHYASIAKVSGAQMVFRVAACCRCTAAWATRVRCRSSASCAKCACIAFSRGRTRFKSAASRAICCGTTCVLTNSAELVPQTVFPRGCSPGGVPQGVFPRGVPPASHGFPRERGSRGTALTGGLL